MQNLWQADMRFMLRAAADIAGCGASDTITSSQSYRRRTSCCAESDALACCLPGPQPLRLGLPPSGAASKQDALVPDPRLLGPAWPSPRRGRQYLTHRLREGLNCWAGRPHPPAHRAADAGISSWAPSQRSNKKNGVYGLQRRLGGQ